MLKDQKELLYEFNEQGVEYVVVGGHAVNAHGVPRTTKNLDILIRAEYPNTARVLAALVRFGAPLAGLSEEDFRSEAEQVFQIGVEPHRIDILQSIDGVSFEEAWQNRVQALIDGELVVPFLGREELLRNKQSTGLSRDAADAEELREFQRVQETIKRNAATGIELLDASKDTEKKDSRRDS